jgi:hypothetical protein
MQTNNSKPTPRVNEDTERFDEITGGYSDYEHDRAAKRIMADIRKMPADVSPSYWCQTSVASPRKHVHPQGSDAPTIRYCVGGVVSASWREPDGTQCAVQLTERSLREMLRACEDGLAKDAARTAIARATNGGGM